MVSRWLLAVVYAILVCIECVHTTFFGIRLVFFKTTVFVARVLVVSGVVAKDVELKG
jgi:hypothetical protein